MPSIIMKDAPIEMLYAKDYLAQMEQQQTVDEPTSASALPTPATAPAEDKEEKKDHDEDDEEEEAEEEERTPPRPRRTSRARLIMVEDSDLDLQQFLNPPKRRGRPRGSGSAKAKAKDSDSGGGSPPDSAEKPKRQSGRPARSNASKEENSSGTDSAADSLYIEVGDCVMLDSGDPDDHYVALVSSVQLSQSSDKPTGFTAQWYYKPDDIRDEVRTSIEGGVLENEVFLSPHKDKNSIDAVVGLCNVVPPEEYFEVQQEIQRGFREKGRKPYYVCRFKYYPSRSVKKALEPLKEEDIRGGLGPQKPKVGEEFQAAIPELKADKPTTVEESIPWKLAARAAPDNSLQVWSRHVVDNQELVFRQFRALFDSIRFGVGNVVRLYRSGDDSKLQGHVRCIILKFAPSEPIEVCASTGERKAMLKGELCSTLSEDVALKILYASRFNLTHATHLCTKKLIEVQRGERDAFAKEVLIFAQLAAQEKARQAALEESSNRKRRK